MSEFAAIEAIPALADHLSAVNYLHVKTVKSRQSLREFAATSLSYMPGWMRLLYRVREYFVMLLGISQEDMPRKETIAPDELSFRPGDLGSFFTVVAGEEDRFWLGEARDDMIVGCLGFICEPGQEGINRFHLVTTATYLRWQARIYFNVIRPFHHLVIHAMARHVLAETKHRS